jgi:hypothetical protein
MRRSILLLAVVLVALLGALAAKSMLVQPPPLRSQSETDQFDANRAKARLAFILGDQRPHTSDTAADDEVRSRIVTLLQQMGLDPVVRDQFACNELYKQRGVACARVRNVIAALGPPAGKALLLNAHYDSTPVGPAAADDGSGVATLLEIAAILKDRRLERPLILLFNEGEELGLVGARAFLADPLSRDVDSLVNLEARGVRGPVNMFETSRPNAAPISIFQKAVANPIANSLSTDVYRLIPNYTDVNSFSERRWLTLNLAPIGNETRYHSPGDDLAALDPATLQHMGDQTLAVAEALAKGTPKASGDQIFMDLAGRTLITLPLGVGVIVLIALLLGTGWIALRGGGLVRGSAAIVATVVGSTILAWVMLALIGLVRPGMFWRAHPLWTHLAVYATAACVAVVLLTLIGGTLDRTRLRPAFWFFFLLVGGMIALIAPGGIIFFLFPPLLALAGMLASRRWKQTEAVGSALALIVLYLTWGAMLGLLEELLNSGPMWLFAPLGLLLIIPVLIEARPIIARAGLRRAAIASGALAILGWAAAAAAPAYSADRQQMFVIENVTDAQSGKSLWSVRNGHAPLPDAYQTGRNWRWDKVPYTETRRWLADAPAAGAKAPSVEPLGSIRNGNQRTITLRLHSNGAERVSLVAPEDARIRSAGTAGFVRPIDSNVEEGQYSVSCSGRSCDGATLYIITDSVKPIEFIVVGLTSGLPASAQPLLSARPEFARPQYAPDQTVAFTRVRL